MPRTEQSTVSVIDFSKPITSHGYEIRGKQYLVDHPEKEAEVGLFVPDEIVYETAPFEDKEDADKVPEEVWSQTYPKAMELRWEIVRDRTEPRVTDRLPVDSVDEELEQKIRSKLIEEDPHTDLGMIMREIVEGGQ